MSYRAAGKWEIWCNNNSAFWPQLISVRKNFNLSNKTPGHSQSLDPTFSVLSLPDTGEEVSIISWYWWGGQYYLCLWPRPGSVTPVSATTSWGGTLCRSGPLSPLTTTTTTLSTDWEGTRPSEVRTFVPFPEMWEFQDSFPTLPNPHIVACQKLTIKTCRVSAEEFIKPQSCLHNQPFLPWPYLHT